MTKMPIYVKMGSILFFLYVQNDSVGPFDHDFFTHLDCTPALRRPIFAADRHTSTPVRGIDRFRHYTFKTMESVGAGNHLLFRVKLVHKSWAKKQDQEERGENESRDLNGPFRINRHQGRNE